MFAMPDHASLYPIHRASVPLKLKVAREPFTADSTALPPLLNEPVLVYQVPEYATAEAFCSTRVKVVVPPVPPPPVVPPAPPPFEVEPPGVPITSNASAHIHPPPDRLFFVPVGRIVSLCV